MTQLLPPQNLFLALEITPPRGSGLEGSQYIGLESSGTDLEGHGAIFQCCNLLPPVEKWIIIDNTGTKIGMSQDARVVEAEVVSLWPDKPVT